jgi:uncharacterized protein DUF29
MSRNTALYDQDFYAWTQEQAALMREGAVHALDLVHLAEEIEDMGHSQQDKLASHLLVLLTHLLKLFLAAQAFPQDYARAARGWRLTCRAQRLQIAKVLRRNPRLRRTVPDELEDAYALARLEVMQDLELEESLVPERYPWDEAQILADDFWPDANWIF